MKRLYHHWEKWECFRAGFYESEAPGGMSSDEARDQYAVFLRDTPRFKAALLRVLAEWPISCDQFLSNENINRIAWLGQASMCIATGVPSRFRGGFWLLTQDEQRTANSTAELALMHWIEGKAIENRPHSTVHPTVGGVRVRGGHPRRSSAAFDAAETCALL